MSLCTFCSFASFQASASATNFRNSSILLLIASYHTSQSAALTQKLLLKNLQNGLTWKCWYNLARSWSSTPFLCQTKHKFPVAWYFSWSYVKTHFSCVKSNILRKYYVIMFTLENSLLRRSIPHRPLGPPSDKACWKCRNTGAHANVDILERESMHVRARTHRDA